MDGVVDRRPVIAIYLLGIVFGKTYLIVEEVWSQYYLTVLREIVPNEVLM
jgi:hypothetical protein